MSTTDVVCDAIRTMIWASENPVPPYFVRMLKNILKLICQDN